MIPATRVGTGARLAAHEAVCPRCGVIRAVNRGEHDRPCGDCVLVLRDHAPFSRSSSTNIWNSVGCSLARRHRAPGMGDLGGEQGRHGQARHGVVAQITHCIHGHEFTPENTTSLSTRGGRICLTCKRERTRRYDAKRRGRSEAAL